MQRGAATLNDPRLDCIPRDRCAHGEPACRSAFVPRLRRSFRTDLSSRRSSAALITCPAAAFPRASARAAPASSSATARAGAGAAPASPAIPGASAALLRRYLPPALAKLLPLGRRQLVEPSVGLPQPLLLRRWQVLELLVALTHPLTLGRRQFAPALEALAACCRCSGVIVSQRSAPRASAACRAGARYHQRLLHRLEHLLLPGRALRPGHAGRRHARPARRRGTRWPAHSPSTDTAAAGRGRCGPSTLHLSCSCAPCRRRARLPRPSRTPPFD